MRGTIEYTTAVLAYCTAKEYRLHGLAKLAKEVIDRHDKGMSISGFLNSMEKTLPKSLEDNPRFCDHVEKKIQGWPNKHVLDFADRTVSKRIWEVAESNRFLKRRILLAYFNKLGDVASKESPSGEPAHKKARTCTRNDEPACVDQVGSSEILIE